jgi:hypothetical protein
MKLARTPRCVGHISSVEQFRELVRRTVDVVHEEPQSRSIACDPDEVMPLQRENSVVATDNNEPRRIRVTAELLDEAEMYVETRRSCRCGRSVQARRAQSLAAWRHCDTSATTATTIDQAPRVSAIPITGERPVLGAAGFLGGRVSRQSSRLRGLR